MVLSLFLNLYFLFLFRLRKTTDFHKDHRGKCGCWRSMAMAGQSSFQTLSHMRRNSGGSGFHSHSCSLLPQVSIQTTDLYRNLYAMCIYKRQYVMNRWMELLSFLFDSDVGGILELSNWRVFVGLVSQLNLPNPIYLKQIILNDNYNTQTKDNDIALLKLETSVSEFLKTQWINKQQIYLIY